MERQKIMAELRKLACGKANDAVKLAFLRPEEAHCIDGLDLRGLAELKRGANGTVELKLVDRLKALEMLERLSRQETEDDLGAFFSDLGKGEGQ